MTDIFKSQEIAILNDENVVQKNKAPRERSVPFALNSVLIYSLKELIRDRDAERSPRQIVSFDGFAPFFLSSVNWNEELVIRDILMYAAQNIDRYCTDRWYDPKEPNFYNSLVIKVIADKRAQTLTITDNGQGLLHNEAVHLMQKIVTRAVNRMNAAIREGFDLTSGNYSLGLLGMFYIAFKITIITKHDRGMHLSWVSPECGRFTIRCHKKKLIERGNRICLHLKRDHLKFLDPENIRKIVTQYCKNIMYPIKVVVEKVAITGTDDNTKVMELGDIISSAYGYKRKTAYIEDVQLNEINPLWTFNSYNVPMTEYSSLYKALTNDFDDFMFVQHFSIDGTHRIDAILFIPQNPPENIFDLKNNQKNLKLYANKQFIMYNNGLLLPECLNFIKGVVDCKDFPTYAKSLMLNEENDVMKNISKALSEKVFDFIASLKDQRDLYEKFYSLYSSYIKIAIMEHANIRHRLKPLLMFTTSKSVGRPRFLDDIAYCMEDTLQDFMYYICGDNIQDCQKSPLVEYFKEINFEVIFLTDPFDVYVIAQMEHFENVAFVSCHIANLPFPMTQKKRKEYEKNQKKLKDFCKIIKGILKAHVSEVVVSKRLIRSPFCVTVVEDSCIPSMDEINNSLAFGTKTLWDMCPRGKRILEINGSSLMIQALVKAQPPYLSNKIFEESIQVLYGAALIASGFGKPHDLHLYKGLIYNFQERGLGLEARDYKNIQNRLHITPPSPPLPSFSFEDFNQNCDEQRSNEIIRACAAVDALQ